MFRSSTKQIVQITHKVEFYLLKIVHPRKHNKIRIEKTKDKIA